MKLERKLKLYNDSYSLTDHIKQTSFVVYSQLCPGGGFGPVSDDGYGVSYMIPGDQKIFFHVSAKNAAPGTSAQKFMDQLFETFQDLKELFTQENSH